MILESVLLRHPHQRSADDHASAATSPLGEAIEDSSGFIVECQLKGLHKRCSYFPHV